jgi:transglutaminase/protease-like cytokinesis protein 3
MKQIKLLFLYLILVLPLAGQKKNVNEFSTIDTKALKLPDSLTRTTDDISKYIISNFRTDTEKTRAIFIWLAKNIQYDIDNMFAINFYEPKEDKISKPLQSRKGICENYAALFNDICSKSGIKSFVIEGYTKQNGFADYLPHAWCAALIDTSWFMFDPTWGSGYINGGKFVKKINNDYYKATPSTLIKSHIPFDYLWQFLNYPITNQEFNEGKIFQNKSKPYFDFIDSLHVYETQNRIDQLIFSSYRIEINGVKNSLIFDRLHHNKLEIEYIKLEIENDRRNKDIDLYNSTVSNYYEATSNFNVFIQYHNKQFTPIKSDQEIQKMIDTVASILKDANSKLIQIKNPDKSTGALISQINKSINELSIQVKEQQDWLTIYFSKNKLKRKSMFYEKKATLFGIPLN